MKFGRKPIGIHLVVGVQRCSDQEEQQRYRKVHQRAEPCRKHGVSCRLCCDVSLHVVLVDTKVLKVDEKSIDQNDPERRLGEVEVETSQTELKIGSPYREHLHGAFG